MAGHSHSSNIKFRKDRVDGKRAKAFAKLSRMITVAARQGGGSIDGNAKLRLSVEKARVLSMPKDVIDRAIKKGTGELDTANYEEILYEAFGPGGVATTVIGPLEGGAGCPTCRGRRTRAGSRGGRASLAVWPPGCSWCCWSPCRD